MKKIAFFDFDGTITTKDTMFEVIKYHKGNTAFYIGFLLNVPFFAALKLKLISNQAAKEKLFKYFFRGTFFSSFQSRCNVFVNNKLHTLIRPGAATEIKRLQEEGFEIAVVSASAENWIRKWTDGIGVHLIATQLEVVDKRLTGRLKGLNCNGEEKVTRIKCAYDLSQYDDIYCYGDSSGDKHMLALGTKAFYKPFRK